MYQTVLFHSDIDKSSETGNIGNDSRNYHTHLQIFDF